MVLMAKTTSDHCHWDRFALLLVSEVLLARVSSALEQDEPDGRVLISDHVALQAQLGLLPSSS